MSSRCIRFTLDLPFKEHKKLKTVANMLGLSMKDFIVLSVQEFMHKKMNKTTEKAIKDATMGKNIKKFQSLEAFFKDLGI